MSRFLLPLFLASVISADSQAVVQTSDQAQLSLANSCSGFKYYAALGDSYSVGLRSDTDGHLPVCPTSNDNGLAPYCTLEHCAKNIGAYAWLFSKGHPSANFQFLACSGANSSDVTVNQTIKYLNPNTDLVTITVGGDNGNAFANIVKSCVYIKNGTLCNAAYENANTVLGTAQAALTDVLNAIIKKAPLAQINILSYVQFWSSMPGNATCQSTTLKSVTDKNKTMMNDLVRKVNNITAVTVTAFNAANANNTRFVKAAFVDVDPAFESHRLCDTTPYFQWEIVNLTSTAVVHACGQESADRDVWPYTGVFHPNELGQQAYLSTFSKVLGC